MTTVLPFAPFPPTAVERPGTVDLAARLQDRFFCAAWLGEPARMALEQRLALAVDGARWGRAAALLRALLDCWPLAATVEAARQGWLDRRDPVALARLARVAEIVRQAQGWEALPAGPWCLPDPAWIRAEVGALSVRVSPRCPADGAQAVAEAIGTPLEAEPDLPQGLSLQPAASLAEHRAALGRSLSEGRLGAVLIQGEHPDDAASQLALGELRLEGSHQHAVERFGLAGLELEPDGPLPAWDQALAPATPGAGGAVLRAVASGRFLPGPVGALAAGRPQRVGYLLWAGPHPPVPVAPVAVAVLQALDGVRDTTAVAQVLGGPIDQVALVLDELVRLGAATHTE
jgi:hypothetical protein